MNQITVINKKMVVGRQELPRLEDGKIRVKVQYSGVGFADLMAVKGRYALAPKGEFSPGYEFAGIVEKPGTEELPAGTKVAGMLPKMGCYREYIDIDPQWAVEVPAGLSPDKAAVLPLNYLTAAALIEKSAKLHQGQSFLIHGAAGGVGSAALELAGILGLTAYGTASAPKHDFVRKLGGIPYDYRNPQWIEDFHKDAPSGVDAVFDAMGAASFNRSWKLLNDTGTLAAYGFYKNSDSGTGDMVAGLLNLLGKALSFTRRKVAVCGTPGICEKDPVWYRQTLSRIFSWAAEGRISAEPFGAYSYEQCDQAHRDLEKRKVIGKLLLNFS